MADTRKKGRKKKLKMNFRWNLMEENSSEIIHYILDRISKLIVPISLQHDAIPLTVFCLIKYDGGNHILF